MALPIVIAGFVVGGAVVSAIPYIIANVVVSFEDREDPREYKIPDTSTEYFSYLATTDEDQFEVHTVFAYQCALESMGYYIGDAGPDGILGADTRKAIEWFQEDNGIEPSGRLNIDTRVAFLRHIEKSQEIQKSLYSKILEQWHKPEIQKHVDLAMHQFDFSNKVSIAIRPDVMVVAALAMLSTPNDVKRRIDHDARELLPHSNHMHVDVARHAYNVAWWDQLGFLPGDTAEKVMTMAETSWRGRFHLQSSVADLVVHSIAEEQSDKNDGYDMEAITEDIEQGIYPVGPTPLVPKI